MLLLPLTTWKNCVHGVSYATRSIGKRNCERRDSIELTDRISMKWLAHSKQHLRIDQKLRSGLQRIAVQRSTFVALISCVSPNDHKCVEKRRCVVAQENEEWENSASHRAITKKLLQLQLQHPRARTPRTCTRSARTCTSQTCIHSTRTFPSSLSLLRDSL